MITMLLCLSLLAPQAATPKPRTIDPAKTKFAKVYRGGKAIQAAMTTGVNKMQFSRLMQEFMTELEIVKDQPLSARDKEIHDLYMTAIASYATMVDCCWTVDEHGEKARLFRKAMRLCDHYMENAHRRVRGLKPLPEPKDEDL